MFRAKNACPAPRTSASSSRRSDVRRLNMACPFWSDWACAGQVPKSLPGGSRRFVTTSKRASDISVNKKC